MRVALEQWLKEQEVLLPDEELIVNFKILQKPRVKMILKKSKQLRREDMTEELTEADWQELLQYQLSSYAKRSLDLLHNTKNEPAYVPYNLCNSINCQLRNQQAPFRILPTESRRGRYWEDRVCRLYKKK